MIQTKLVENDTLEGKNAADQLMLEAQRLAFTTNLPVAMRKNVIK